MKKQFTQEQIVPVIKGLGHWEHRIVENVLVFPIPKGYDGEKVSKEIYTWLNKGKNAKS